MAARAWDVLGLEAGRMWLSAGGIGDVGVRRRRRWECAAGSGCAWKMKIRRFWSADWRVDIAKIWPTWIVIMVLGARFVDDEHDDDQYEKG